MSRTIIAAAAAASLLGLASCSRQPGVTENAATQAAATGNSAAPLPGDVINGAWEADLSTVTMPETDRYLLKDGQFSCASCAPPLTIAADGAFHPVTGRPYADSMAVKVVDDKTVTRTAKKGGRVTSEIKWSVSPDNNKLTVEFSNSSVPNAPPVTGRYSGVRSAAAPSGAHAISGSWNIDKLESLSAGGLNVSFKLEGDTLHMSSPDGRSYDAKLDGTEAPIRNDIAGSSVSVKKTGDNSYRETEKRGGKIVNVTTFAVRSDGKLDVTIENRQTGNVIKYVAKKA